MESMEEAIPLATDNNTRHRTIHKARPEEGLACEAVEDISVMAKEAWGQGTMAVGLYLYWVLLAALCPLTGI